jgi:SAM-dependent methyltransferase
MFVPNLGEALRRVHRALKPGGRFAALVWSTEERNPWIGIQLRPIRDMNRVPSPPPSIFLTVSLSDPDVLKGAFTEAGFSDVSVSAVSTPREFHDLDEAWDAMQTTSSPSAAQFTKTMSDDERARYSAELQRGLAALVQGDGRCVIPGEALLVVGTR